MPAKLGISNLCDPQAQSLFRAALVMLYLLAKSPDQSGYQAPVIVLGLDDMSL